MSNSDMCECAFKVMVLDWGPFSQIIFRLGFNSDGSFPLIQATMKALIQNFPYDIVAIL